jgi:hypothetical protein
MGGKRCGFFNKQKREFGEAGKVFIAHQSTVGLHEGRIWLLAGYLKVGPSKMELENYK